jgi:hypothetical protein
MDIPKSTDLVDRHTDAAIRALGLPNTNRWREDARTLVVVEALKDAERAGAHKAALYAIDRRTRDPLSIGERIMLDAIEHATK